NHKPPLMNDTPRDREPVRRVPADPPQPYVTETVTPKRDIFPYVMGALIAALVVGFGVIVFVLGGPGNTSVAPVPTPITNAPAGVPTSPSDVLPSPEIPNSQPTNAAGSSNSNDIVSSPTAPSGASPVATVQPTVPAGSTDGDVPRISMDDFKSLYDDPAKRPVIIDVRSKEGYDAGHIKGSINFPEDQIAVLISDLPKDKLVVAYCS
ncbi:MAG: rhodanese-like domain-containing protein, partial [Chloroflexia bacterium]